MNNKLVGFFYELLRLGLIYPGQGKFGSPISILMEQMVKYQDDFIRKVLKPNSMINEMRLNGLGLKLMWYKQGVNLKFFLDGPEVKDYPEFVKEAEKAIRYFGFERRL